jgi:hypothetical protein
LLDSLNIEYSREFTISSYSYDFKVGDTLIEINPSIFHNTLINPYGESRIDKNYHKGKSELAERTGFRCIHIWDWDDINKVANLLLNREKVYARECTVKDIGIDTVSDFLNKYHLQGSCKGQDIRLGLFVGDDLVSVMTFGSPRYNSNYQYELLRYCSKDNVIGGAEKLFKHFIREYNPKSIISYCDRSKFKGVVYSNLGFSLINDGTPTKHWYSIKENRHITDNLLRQMGYDKLFNENYGKGTSNEELIIKRGYVPVYDCGQAVYKWSGSN